MLESFRRDHRERDAPVAGIVLDGADARATVRRTAERHGTTCPVLVATGDGFDAAFERLTGAAVRATPTRLFHDRAGTFVGAHAGPLARRALDELVTGRIEMDRTAGRR